MSIDYNKAYDDHLLCRNCNRQTTGIKDFMTKTMKVAKTCKKCRDSVLTSLQKKDRIVPKTITLKEQNTYLKKIMLGLDDEQ